MRTPSDRPPEQSPAPPLPSGLVRAVLQVDVLHIACAQPGPFAAKDLSLLVGIAAARITHALRLPRGTGLIEAAPGRLHRATAAGRKVGQRWTHGNDEGHAALREAWEETWFIRCVRHHLQVGPVTAQDLAAHLFTQARTGPHGRLEVEVLIDILAHIGFLQTPRPGLVALRPPHPQQRSGRDHGKPAPPLPDPRRGEADWSEVEELLANPIRAADLIRLTPADHERVQQHLTRLATIIIAARRRPTADTPD